MKNRISELQVSNYCSIRGYPSSWKVLKMAEKVYLMILSRIERYIPSAGRVWCAEPSVNRYSEYAAYRLTNHLPFFAIYGCWSVPALHRSVRSKRCRQAATSHGCSKEGEFSASAVERTERSFRMRCAFSNCSCGSNIPIGINYSRSSPQRRTPCWSDLYHPPNLDRCGTFQTLRDGRNCSDR